MHTTITVIAVVGMVVLAIIILSLRDRRIWRNRNRKYLRTQVGRTVLMDQEFCRQAKVDPSAAATIGIIRTNLAEFQQCDATRIYPEDMLSDFGLNYDDDVAMLVQKMGIIPGFADYSFPSENVDNVASFARMLLKMKQTAQPAC